jgi:anti-sigma regulatory factor (Ser/Thr protein kinase)
MTATLTRPGSERAAVIRTAERICRLELAALPNAVRYARLHTADTLRAWGLTALHEPARLVVSELVTHAVTHAAPPPARPVVVLTLVLIGDRLGIEVWGGDMTPPGRRYAGPTTSGTQEHGQGLAPVEELAVRWNYTHPPRGGTTVWCELAIPPPRQREERPSLGSWRKGTGDDHH